MKAITNSKTGKTDYQFTGKLLTIEDEVRSNTNGTNYVLGTISFVNAKGQVKEATCAVYENNLKHGMETGKEYLCTASQGADNRMYIHVSHLQNVSAATTDDFGIEAVATPRVETAAAEMTA